MYQIQDTVSRYTRKPNRWMVGDMPYRPSGWDITSKLLVTASVIVLILVPVMLLKVA